MVSDTDEDYYINLLKEEDEDTEDDSFLPSDAMNAYRDKQRVKKEWGRELENWKQLGVQARRDRRDQLRKKKFSIQAETMAQEYVFATDHSIGQQLEEEIVNAAADAGTPAKIQLEKATALFQRLLEHLYEMEQDAYNRGKELAIQREAEKASGTATDIQDYLEELEGVRETEQENRRLQKERVFELPEDWELLLDDDDLITILKIRGNVRNVGKVQKRETIERYVRESRVLRRQVTSSPRPSTAHSIKIRSL
jgi:hypothetical protein